MEAQRQPTFVCRWCNVTCIKEINWNDCSLVFCLISKDKDHGANWESVLV